MSRALATRRGGGGAWTKDDLLRLGSPISRSGWEYAKVLHQEWLRRQGYTEEDLAWLYRYGWNSVTAWLDEVLPSR
jgi:hypothetical protein